MKAWQLTLHAALCCAQHVAETGLPKTEETLETFNFFWYYAYYTRFEQVLMMMMMVTWPTMSLCRCKLAPDATEGNKATTHCCTSRTLLM